MRQTTNVTLSGNARVEVVRANHVFVRLQSDFEDVPLLGLSQEEKHGLGFVRGTADEQHSALGVVEVVASARDGTANIGLIAKVLVRDVVLGADEHTARSFVAARNYKNIECWFANRVEKKKPGEDEDLPLIRKLACSSNCSEYLRTT